MKFLKTKISGVYIINLELKIDNRGYFARNYCHIELKNNNIQYNIVQINRSYTKKKGTIRGLHFQKNPFEEDKIIQCIKGSIFDVAVDLRKNSSTFGEWISQNLTESNQQMLLIPKGCAHGFQSLENNCEIQYFVSQYYNPRVDTGIRWNDPTIRIKWPIKNSIISEKDTNLPFFNRL